MIAKRGKGLDDLQIKNMGKSLACGNGDDSTLAHLEHDPSCTHTSPKNTITVGFPIMLCAGRQGMEGSVSSPPRQHVSTSPSLPQQSPGKSRAPTASIRLPVGIFLIGDRCGGGSCHWMVTPGCRWMNQPVSRAPPRDLLHFLLWLPSRRDCKL